MLLRNGSRANALGRIVPISLEMDETHQTMVISGPNAGGKTVVLKTVGLITLMAQMGLHVPASDAALPIFADRRLRDSSSIPMPTSTVSLRIDPSPQLRATF